jgi:hypothetical protein
MACPPLWRTAVDKFSGVCGLRAGNVGVRVHGCLRPVPSTVHIMVRCARCLVLRAAACNSASFIHLTLPSRCSALEAALASRHGFVVYIRGGCIYPISACQRWGWHVRSIVVRRPIQAAHYFSYCCTYSFLVVIDYKCLMSLRSAYSGGVCLGWVQPRSWARVQSAVRLRRQWLHLFVSH